MSATIIILALIAAFLGLRLYTVLGKHGRSAAEDFFLGSVTRSVLTEGSIDVLVSVAGSA